MPNSKRSITFKVIAGYVLIAALAGISVWFIYTQVVAFSDLSQQNNNNNEKLFLVSEITSSLYESENISRRVIQTGDEEDLSSYRARITALAIGNAPEDDLPGQPDAKGTGQHQ